MATKIEKTGNFNVFTDTVTGVDHHYISSMLSWDVGDNGNVFYFKDTQQDYTFHYNFSDLVDKDGVAWADVATLKTWLGIKVGVTGTLDVLLQDGTAPLFIVKASNLIAETTTSGVLAKDDLVVGVVSATGFVVGQYLTIYNVVSNRVYFGTVLSIASLDITLDTPIDFEFPAGSFVSVGNTNMNVNGSVTPQIFGIRNPSAVDIPLSVDFTRVMVKCLTATSIDLSEFGDISGGLTNGIVIRKIDGEYYNILNAKTNGELKNIMFDFDIQAASGNQQDGFTGRLTFAGQDKMGAVIRLKEAEDLQIIIQDDLTSLTSLQIIVEGSQVVD